MAVILSPGWNPAAAAAEFGETFVTSERSALTPTPKKIEKIRRKPMMKWAVDPAPSTINLRVVVAP